MAEVTPSRVRNQDRELVICALYSGGETMEAIAARFPSSHSGRVTITRERVRQILLRNGLGGFGRQARGVDPLKVLGLVAECGSVKEIAQRLDGCEKAVAKVLRTLAPMALVEMDAYRHEAYRERLLQRIRDLAKTLGRRPFKADLDEHGPHQGQLQITFGAMSRAMILAGFQPLRSSHPHMTPAQRVVIALRYRPAPLGQRSGGNLTDLAEEYGVTATRILQIAREFRAAA